MKILNQCAMLPALCIATLTVAVGCKEQKSPATTSVPLGAPVWKPSHVYIAISLLVPKAVGNPTDNPLDRPEPHEAGLVLCYSGSNVREAVRAGNLMESSAVLHEHVTQKTQATLATAQVRVRLSRVQLVGTAGETLLQREITVTLLRENAMSNRWMLAEESVNAIENLWKTVPAEIPPRPRF